jgi:putative transposase
MSTCLSLYDHFVFSTKNRQPLIDKSWQSRLHKYMGGTVSGLGGVSEGIGGINDHVHLLVSLKATHCLSDFMRELKKSSSVWVLEEIGLETFGWQDGYAAFTVSATAITQVKGYIERQAEHHAKKPFRDELIQMLRRARVKYDPAYLD